MLHPIQALDQLNVSNGIVWEVLKGDHGIPATKAPGLFLSFVCRIIAEYDSLGRCR